MKSGNHFANHPFGQQLPLAEEPVLTYSLSSYDFIRLSRQGILKKTLLQIAEKLSFTFQELSKILHISERTLQRYRDTDTLAPDTSERTLLLAQLYNKGIAVFKTADNFNDWMRSPLAVFNDQAPVQFLDTAFGFQLIFDELGRIEHGIFA